MRPQPVVMLAPNIWYVDLTRVLAADLAPIIGTLAKAPGVVFDVRGGIRRMPVRGCFRTYSRRPNTIGGCTSQRSLVLSVSWQDGRTSAGT
jgi:hypothetical protein